MEKVKFLLHKKIIFLFFLIFALANNSAFSQCTNPPPTGDASQVFCKADNSTVANLVAIGGSIVWYDAPSGGELYDPTEILVNGKIYYADNISSNSCSTSRLAVSVTIYGDYPTNVDVSVGKCAIDNPTVGSLSAIGENIAWYDAQTGGNLLPLSTLLENGKTYWVQQTENGCTSDRFPTTVSLIEPLTPTTAPIQSFCSPPNATVANLRATGTTILWYDSETSTTPLKSTTLLINGEDYWAAEITFPCVSSNRAKTTVVIDIAPDAGESSALQECEVNFVTTNLFDLLGGTPDTTGIWTGPSALSNGYLGTFEPGINTIGTYTYTVSSTLGICPNDSANIAITIVVVPPPTTANIIQVFCEIEKATIADLSANGNNIVWYDTETSTIALNPSETLVEGEDYWGALPDPTSGCLSAIRLKITAIVTVIPPPTTAEANQIFCEIENATVGDLSATGSGKLWYDTETSSTPLSPSEGLIEGEDYWASQTDPTSACESATRLVVTVSILIPPPPTTTQANQIFCEIDNAKIGDLSASGTGILWYDTETSTTPLNVTNLLVNGENYWATQTNATSGCESANRLVVTVTIIAPTPPTTTQVNQTFCEIDNPKVANLSASGTGILWYASETSTIPLNPTALLVNGASYWGTQTDATSSCESKNRLVVNVSIIAPPPPTTSTQNQIFCAINNPTITNLSATGTGILWYASETSTIQLNPTALLVDGATYWASQTVASGCESANRLAVNVTVITPAPPITISQNKTFCEIEKATITNLNEPGNVLLWYATETSTTPLNATDLLVDGSVYWATQTISAEGCEIANRLKVTVSITKILPPTTTQASQIFCEIENAKIGDLSTNENNVVWYASETSSMPLNTSEILIDGEDYWGALTDQVSGCESANRLKINVSIIIAGQPKTIEQNKSFCEIDNPTITDLNTFGNELLWYASENSIIPINETDLVIDGAVYWASTSSCESTIKLKITVTIIKTPAPTTSTQNQIFCAINNPTIANLSPSGNEILWYASETSTAQLNPTDLLVDGAKYWASQTAASGCESAKRLVVNVSIITPETTTIEQNKSFCDIENATIANLNDPVNILLWYDSETSSTALNATDLLVDGKTYWAKTTICESTVQIKVIVAITKILPPTTTQANQIFCEIENAKIGDLSAMGTEILWYDTETSTIPLNDANLLVNGLIYWATQTDPVSGCESASRLAVTVVINVTPPPTTTNVNQAFCIKDYLPNAPTISDLNASGSGIRWYATETSTIALNPTDLLVNGASYWATQTNATTGCESASRLMVNVSIIDPAIPTTTSVNQTFCAAENPTIGSLQASGTSIIWYANEAATIPLNNTDLLINGEDYWVAASNSSTGCESIARLRIIVSITDVAPATIVNVSQTFCESDSPTIANLAVTGNGILWYATQTSTTPMSVATQLINGTAYWAAQSNATTGCISSVRVVANVTLTAIETPTLISLGNEFCKINNPTISDLNLNVSANNGGTISWYDNFPNGNLLNVAAALVEGETYYAIETDANGCKNINPLEVTVTLEACDEYDIEIYDGFSPTGNGTNDTFKIKNLRELYPDFKVEFFNRWGNLIYTSSAANGDWNGRLNGDGELSPAGVYFFVIYFNKENRKPIQRRLYLSR